MLNMLTISALLITLAFCITVYVLGRFLLPARTFPSATFKEGLIFTWLIFDTAVHYVVCRDSIQLSWEPPFVWPAQTYPASKALLWQEFSGADRPWDSAKPILVMMQLLAVLAAGPMCVFLASQTLKRTNSRHVLTIILALTEIYAALVGFTTFTPERLAGKSPQERAEIRNQWIYFFNVNMLWVVIPSRLLWDACVDLLYGANKRVERDALEKEDVEEASHTWVAL